MVLYILFIFTHTHKYSILAHTHGQKEERGKTKHTDRRKKGERQKHTYTSSKTHPSKYGRAFISVRFFTRFSWWWMTVEIGEGR
jgi:hypothetical protein